MQKSVILPLMLGAAVLSACSTLQPDKKKTAAAPPPVVRLTLLPQEALAAGKTTTVLAKVTDIPSGYAFTDNDLETVHTQKFHLLIVDPSLTDYQHIHPQPTGTPGLYSFRFTPKLPGGYRAWADVTPKTTGREEFAMTDLGRHHAKPIDRSERHEASVSGYHFTLTLDKPLIAGNSIMASIHVTDNRGNPVTGLEPIMGAFAHIAGFYDDYRTVMHVHPQGNEPSSDSARAGPEVTFMLMPEKAGFVKLFAQFKINGSDITVPFGVNVAKGS